MSACATVAWDEWGVAHIHGDDEQSVFRALGWVQCEAHLEELLAQWKLVRAELHEVLGDRGAPPDAVSRQFDHLGAARRAYLVAPTWMQRRHAAFVDGVRRWMALHPESVPSWAPPLEDCLPLGAVRTQTWPWCIYDALTAALGADAPAPGASNWWAVSGDRTADGVPYLLSDPHLPLGGLTHEPPAGSPPRPVPGLEIVEVSLRCPGLDVTGFVAVGVAVPYLGHTRHLAWGLTTGGPRVSSVGPDGIVTTYDEGVERVEAAFWHLATARCVQDVIDGWDAGGLFPQNVLVVDSSGDSWYVRTGRVVRSGREIVAEDLVQLRGMPDGWIQNCNSGPDVSADGVDLCVGKGPDVVNDRPGRHTSRSRRLHELLPALVEATHEDLVAIATDDTWPDTPPWRAALARIAPMDPLVDFDGRASGGSIAALRWLRWREAVAASSSSSDLQLRVIAGEPDDQDLALLSASLPPPSTERLGDVMRFGRQGDQPGANASFMAFAPAPGDIEGVSMATQAPLRVMGFSGAPPPRHVTFGGCFLRLTRLEPGNVRSWSVVLPGLASRPGHRHSNDQWALAYSGTLRPTAATWAEALSGAVRVEQV